ncbi:MAG: tetratricopeptide repeat protein [Steroidobacteraceae bacterium]|nr:tetratricopeptide repeat protein [Steroidobacteraceae bacterium]
MAIVVQNGFGRAARAGNRYLGCAVAGLLASAAAQAAAPELEQAAQLLAAGQAAEAAALYEKALEADPGAVDARLGLGRAYFAMGEYALARIEFEAVLNYQGLGPDMLTQGEAYDQMAEDYAAGRKWRPFYYAETGIGNYRENSSKGTDVFGGAGDYDTFLPIRVGGGWNADLGDRHFFNGSLDYRFRWYDESGRRNDSDLRWNFNVSRPVDGDNLRFGMRGRVSYRGDGQYRNDWGAFTDYRLGLGARDQLMIGGEVRERRYPDGPLRSRTRDIAELTVNWTHALENGNTSFSLGGNLGQEWATQDRPEGDASFWGFNGGVDHAFNESLDAFFWWSYVNESFDDERPDFTSDPDLLRLRNDDLWNFGGGLVWGFAPGWSLRPTFEYNWEDSSIPALAYSSTELWLTVRKSF